MYMDHQLEKKFFTNFELIRIKRVYLYLEQQQQFSIIINTAHKRSKIKD